MNLLPALIYRDTKLFFKDKGAFFSAMIAPLILLFLFVTFLGNVYRESLEAGLDGISIGEDLVNGFVSGWLISSLLAVCCVTTAFTANMIMVQDKVNGSLADISVAPVKSSVIGLGYYFSTALVTGIISYVCVAAGFVYMASVGWFLSVSDTLFVLLDVLLLVLFGTALSSIVCRFLNSQGGISAVTAIISAVYGFLCGAYMPISSFSPAIRNFISLLPGTYGTSLLRTHMFSGVLDEMRNSGIPDEMLDGLRDAFDVNAYLFEKQVTVPAMFLILGGAVAVCIAVFVVLNRRSGKRA